MGRSTQLAAIFGHPTELRGYTRYTQQFTIDPETGGPAAMQEEALQWMPGQLDVVPGDPSRLRRKPAKGTPSIVKNRWIYVFAARSSSGGDVETQWVLEAWTDASGKIVVNPNNSLSDRLKWTPEEQGGKAKFKNELPVATPTSRLDYVLIGTPFRLTNECLEGLCKDNELLKWESPIDPRKYLRQHFHHEHGHEIPTPPILALPVLLPFDVARNLSADIGLYRSLRLNHMGIEGTHGKPGKPQIEEAKQCSFTKPLLAMVRHPDLQSDLENAVTVPGLAEMKLVVERHERKLAAYDALAEGTAAELCMWLERDLVRALLEGCIPDHDDALLVAIDESLGFLDQSGAGLQWLPKFFDPKTAAEPIRRYFLGSSPLSDDQLSLVRASAKNFLNTFKYRLHGEAIHNKKAIVAVLEELQAKAGITGPHPSGNSYEVLRRRIKHVRVNYSTGAGKLASDTIEARVFAVAADVDAIEDLERRLGVSGFMVGILDGVNFTLAVQSYLEVDEVKAELAERKQLDATLAGMGLLVDILNATFDAVGRKSIGLTARVAVHGVGVFAAVLTAVLAHHDGTKLWQRGDLDAAVAIYVSAGFELLSAAALLAGAILGTSTFFGPIGWVAAIIGALVYAVHLALRDTDMQTFVSHTEYGSLKDVGEGLAPWCRYPLNELSASWDRQLETLDRLRRQFAVGFGDQVRVGGQLRPFYDARIYVGGVDEGTRFRVQWRWESITGAAGEHEESWILQRGRGDHGGANIREFGRKLRASTLGALYFDLRAPEQAWRDANVPGTGPYGFRYLRVIVNQTFKTSFRTTFRIPDESSLDLMVQERHEKPDLQRVLLSVEQR